jgi:hypothetical protein
MSANLIYHIGVEHIGFPYVSSGLKLDLLSSPKLVLLEGDTSRTRFGLDAERYEEVRSTTTLARYPG